MQNIPLNEDKPKDILLNSDAVTALITDYNNWQEPENNRLKSRELTISYIIETILGLLAVLTSWNGMSNVLRFVSIVVEIVLVGLAFYHGIKWREAYKNLENQNPKSLDSMLMEKAKEDIKYTGIARITYKHKGQMQYLVGPDFFLPHCNLNKKLAINEQKSNLIQSLQDNFGIKENSIIKVTPIDEKIHYSIKPIRGSIQMNAFVFYDVFIKEQDKEKLITQSDKRRWSSIDQMKKNTIAMSTNKDVIDLLEDFPNPVESFINMLGNIKIIWNITSKCSYNCAICATHDEKRIELGLNEKYRVLNSICTAKHMIKNLDFAGGDPLMFDDNITVIQSAVEQLDADKVSVTTTGKSLTALSKEAFPRIVRHCEITIDAAHNELQNSDEDMPVRLVTRNEKDYSKTNIESISLISTYADSLIINIPVIDDDLSEQEIETLTQKVLWIKTHTSKIDVDVSLIRLMPVGRLPHNIEKNAYNNYNPISVIKKIQKALGDNGIECRLHCSLRILPAFNTCVHDNHCNMLENKLGIDCAGNVFACAWGGYLNSEDPPTKNPFYLGNLTKVPLIKILTGISRTKPYSDILAEIDTNNHRDYCSVISYYSKKKLFENYDPLAQIELHSD